MKRMKKAVAFESSLPVVVVHEDARIRFKHQSLMQDYEELEKETESMKSKLQTMQQKRLILMAEVRFLRRRFKHLTENQPITTPTQVASKPGNIHQKLESHENRRSNNIAKGKKNNKKESVFRYPSQTLLDLNQKDTNHSNAAALEASPPIFFDLNQKARSLDLNQLDRIHSGKETSKQKDILFFDLNQISGEEEDLQYHGEPLKGLLRSANKNNNNNNLNNSSEEQQNSDMKLLACRSIENGPSRLGKRKITWQDQVALRV